MNELTKDYFLVDSITTKKEIPLHSKETNENS